MAISTLKNLMDTGCKILSGGTYNSYPSSEENKEKERKNGGSRVSMSDGPFYSKI